MLRIISVVSLLDKIICISVDRNNLYLHQLFRSKLGSLKSCKIAQPNIKVQSLIESDHLEDSSRNALHSIEGPLSIVFVQSPSQFVLTVACKHSAWTHVSIIPTCQVLVFCGPYILGFDSQIVLAPHLFRDIKFRFPFSQNFLSFTYTLFLFFNFFLYFKAFSCRPSLKKKKEKITSPEFPGGSGG